MLPDLMQATGIKVHNQYLDPYFWKTDAPVGGLDQIPEGAGYRQVGRYLSLLL